MPSLEITFLGTGTSQGVPVIGCDCPVCRSVDPRDHRTRTSLLVKAPDRHLVIDTAPDFRIQCLREGVTRLDAALITHPHTDHIMGFDDMRRFCEMEDRRMPVFASPETMSQLRATFRYAFDGNQTWKNYLRLAPEEITGPFSIGETDIIPVDLPHGKFTTTGFVFQRGGRKLLAYFTDCSGLPEEAVEAARGVEILVLDTLREAFHPTHMNFDQALEASRAVAPGKTYLTHLCHEVSHAAKEPALPEGCRLAYDGLTLRVGGVMSRPRSCLGVLLLSVLCCSSCHGEPVISPEVRATAVIFNAKSPGSRDLALFYAARRGIPEDHLIGLDLPTSEEIGRKEYDALIAAPLRGEFVKRGWWLTTRDMLQRTIVYASTIRYVVLMRGIPLKIAQTSEYPGDAKIQPDPYGGVNGASVDSELCVAGLFTPQISGVLNNPLHADPPASEAKQPVPPGLLLVTRLDGPDDDSVRGMILDGIRAEQQGLWGWGYTDLRATDETGYIRGEKWITGAGEELRRHGVPVITDDLPETFQEGFPITDAAAYFGWYADHINGPFAADPFRFVPGAVAVHLHSFSASTLRDPLKGWAGPLVARGAGATLGNVYEPYLPFTTNLELFARGLLSGKNLALSFYEAQPVLSWMSVCLGDPLYRPYARFSDPAPEVVDNPWIDYRRIILAHDGNVVAAGGDLTRRSRETGRSLYLEALGNAQMASGENRKAEKSFSEASVLEKSPDIRFRLLLEEARAMEKQREQVSAIPLLKAALGSEASPARRTLLRAWIDRMTSAVTTLPKNAK